MTKNPIIFTVAETNKILYEKRDLIYLQETDTIGFRIKNLKQLKISLLYNCNVVLKRKTTFQ